MLDCVTEKNAQLQKDLELRNKEISDLQRRNEKKHQLAKRFLAMYETALVNSRNNANKAMKIFHHTFMQICEIMESTGQSRHWVRETIESYADQHVFNLEDTTKKDSITAPRWMPSMKGSSDVAATFSRTP